MYIYTLQVLSFHDSYIFFKIAHIRNTLSVTFRHVEKNLKTFLYTEEGGNLKCVFRVQSLGISIRYISIDECRPVHVLRTAVSHASASSARKNISANKFRISGEERYRNFIFFFYF